MQKRCPIFCDSRGADALRERFECFPKRSRSVVALDITKRCCVYQNQTDCTFVHQVFNDRIHVLGRPAELNARRRAIAIDRDQTAYSVEGHSSATNKSPGRGMHTPRFRMNRPQTPAA